MDQNIIQKAKNAVLNTFQNIRSKTINTPLAKNLQSTFYGQGYQAPVQKQLPSLNYFKDLQTGNLRSGIKTIDYAGQAVGSFTQNRIIEPIKAIPTNLRTIKTEAPKIISSKTTGREKINALLSTGIAGLSTVGAVIPFGPEDFAMAGYDTLKARASGKNALKGFTGEEYTGLGEAFKNAPESLKAGLSALELPAVIAAGSISSKVGAMRNARRIFIDNNPKQVSEALSLLRKAEMSYKPTYRKGPNKPSLSISELKKIEDVAQSVIPQVIKNKEMVSLRQSDPSQYYRTLNTFIQEQVVDAFHPELNIGLQAKPQRKLSDFPDLQAKGLTPEVNKVKLKTKPQELEPVFKRGDITNIEKRIDDLLGTESFMRDKSWKNRLPARETALKQLEQYAQEDPGSQIILNEVKKLQKNLDDSRMFNQNPQLLKQYEKEFGKIVPGSDITPPGYMESLGATLDKPPKVKLTTKPSIQPEQGKVTPEIPLGQKQRKFVTSVQEAPNIMEPVKVKVKGTYIQKPNTKLMGEAQALLQDGATIDWKNTQNLDQKVAATIKQAINEQGAGNHQAAANLFNNLSEHGTELGRGVQAFSLLKNMSPEAIALSAAGKIKKYNLTATRKIPELTGEQLKMISDKVDELDLLKGREKNIALNEINNMVNEFIPSSLADKALSVWKAGLLTSLRTHERNFVGNAIHGVVETAKDVPGSLADIGMSAFTGKRTLTATVKGLGEFGSKSTRQQMADIFKKGYDPSEQINKFDHKQITWGKNPVEQTLKKYTDVVFRSLGASDKPFYNSAYARSLYSQAGAEAINVGKRGDAKFIENLVKNPTELMVKNAISDANVATFKNKNAATNITSALKREMGKNEWTKIAGEVTMPFTGVPSSILGQITSYSPVGLVKGIVNTGRVISGKVPELQRQAAQEIGRGVIGTGIFGLGAYLAGKGIITGQPKDATEARQWELENKPRNSILINGKWKSLNSIGPEAIVFLAGAKLNEELGKPEGSIANYGVSLGKDFIDQSFLTGVQGPVNAITDPQRYAKSYLGQLVSSPIPNIIKDVAKATDKTARETNTVLDYAKSGIPGVRQTLTEKRDVLGSVIPQEPTGLNAFIDLFNTKTPVVNNVVSELSRLNQVGENATPSKLTPSQTILKRKVKLTFDELNKLEKGSGEAVTFALNKLISNPNYAQLTDEEKSKAIDKVVTDTRTKFKNINAGQITPQITTPSTQTTQGLIGKTYSYVDDTGNYKEVSLNPIVKPELTGQKELDKLKLSQYYSKITAQKTAVTKLQEEGQITPVEAENLLGKLIEQSKSSKFKRVSIKKPKKLTLKKVKTPKISKIKLKKIKIAKVKPIKFKKIKQPKLAKLKTKKIKS